MSELPPALRHVSPVELSERMRAERLGRPFLLLRDGDGRQRIVDLGGPERALSIGRDPSNDVALEWDSEISRTHALADRDHLRATLRLTLRDKAPNRVLTVPVRL